MKSRKITLHLGERSYDIWVACDRYRGLGRLLRRRELGRRALIVTTQKIRSKHGKDLETALRGAGLSYHFFVTRQTDDRAKSLKFIIRLIREIDKAKADYLVCFAGGVLGDSTGFSAAIYKRGIPYVQIPTTLLAQVDSAIGGKTAIDLPNAKNRLGAFYQPRLVYSDLSVLRELPDRNFEDGLAEAIKYGAICDERFFRFIETNAEELLGREIAPLRHLVTACSRFKARVVEQDEYDRKGIRIILNYGHTLGHALEQVAGYRTNHGRAISVGMCLAADISERLGLLRRADKERLQTLLKRVGLPTTLKELNRRRHWSLDRILQAEGLDKKFIRGRRYVLPVRIGKAIVQEGIPDRLIRHVLVKRLD